MTDWLRKFLMPGAVITIVATVWSLAWANEVQWKARRAAQKSGCEITIRDDGDGYPAVQLKGPSKPTASNTVATSDDGN